MVVVLVDAFTVAVLCTIAGHVGTPQTLFSPANLGYTYFWAPAAVVTQVHTVLVFAEARMGGDSDKTDIAMRRSLDGGETFQPIRLIVTQSGTNTSFGNLVPVYLRNRERVLLVFCVNNTEVWTTSSDDDGMTWSVARNITSAVKRPDWGWMATGPANGIQISSGRVLVPLDTWPSRATITLDVSLAPGALHRNRVCPGASVLYSTDGSHFERWKGTKQVPDCGPGGCDSPVQPPCALDLPMLWTTMTTTRVIYSDDEGETFNVSAPVPGVRSGDESAVAELADGTILKRLRVEGEAIDGCHHFSTSEDGGMHWSEPFVAHIADDPQHTCVPDPTCEASLLAVGSAVFLAGPRIGGGSHMQGDRVNVTIWRSMDSGRSWSRFSQVCDGISEYNTMVRLGDKELAIAYNAGAHSAPDLASTIYWKKYGILASPHPTGTAPVEERQGVSHVW